MFQRALKLKFNEEKYLQVSTVRLRRLEPELMCLKGQRIAMLFGLFFLGHLVRWYRKSPTHKVCYTPLRKGLTRLQDEEYHRVLAESEGYGVMPPPKGKLYV